MQIGGIHEPPKGGFDSRPCRLGVVMAKLTKSKRAKLPTSDFAAPGRAFPIFDKAHARAAIMLSKYAPNPAAVKRKAEKKLRG